MDLIYQSPVGHTNKIEVFVPRPGGDEQRMESERDRSVHRQSPVLPEEHAEDGSAGMRNWGIRYLSGLNKNELEWEKKDI